VLPDEDAAEFAALEAALTAGLLPEGTLQSILIGRIARAVWRVERAERLAAGTGLGVPFPNPAAKRSSCSRGGVGWAAASGSP
jgi:hypothetical protein